MDQHELIEWVHDHRDDLHAISARFGTDERVTRGLALMVLSGYSDADVYVDLGHEILVWDGQESPLRDVPEVLAAVRRLVTQA
jgi:hypothetical protein